MMYFSIAVLCLVVVLLGIVFLIRDLSRRYSCRRIAAQLKPLSDHAREVLALDTQGHVPSTWMEFGDLYRTTHNLTWLSLLSRRFWYAIDSCTDDYCIANMQLTYITFARKRAILCRSLVIGFAHGCFGKIGRHNCKHMADVARNYTDILLAGQEMAEVMDRSCMPILEGQFLHGT